MALLSGFTPLDPSADTFSDWLNKTNEMVNLMRTEVVTANASIANTDGNMNLNGSMTANLVYVTDNLFGGSYDFVGGSFVTSDLIISTNTIFDTNVAIVSVANDLEVLNDVAVSANLTVNANSYLMGSITTDTNLTINSNTTITLADGVQEFITPTNTGITIATNDEGSIEFNADSGAVSNVANFSFMISNVQTVEIKNDGSVSFYDNIGNNEIIVYDNATQRFGIHTTTPNYELDVVGTTQTNNLIVTDTVDVPLITSPANTLVVSPTTLFTNDINVGGNTAVVDLDVNGTLTYVIDDSNYIDLIPTATGDNLGNTTNRWDGFFNDVDITGNTVANTVVVDTLTVTTEANFDGLNTFGGQTEFVDINVANTANLNILSVQELVTNTAAIVGEVASITTSTPTIIDSFDKTVTSGFKYMIHGRNDHTESTYIVEVMCAHNGNEMFFTRYGELQNQFDVTLIPSINGANVELTATCPMGDVANVHSFNIVRLDSRDTV